jgi:hypothetical protein
MFLSPELLRALRDDREREVRDHLRVRALLRRGETSTPERQPLPPAVRQERVTVV